jgi:hypothetical protein
VCRYVLVWCLRDVIGIYLLRHLLLVLFGRLLRQLQPGEYRHPAGRSSGPGGKENRDADGFPGVIKEEGNTIDAYECRLKTEAIGEPGRRQGEKKPSAWRLFDDRGD